EVGVRKVLGSGRRKLVAQFIFESVLFTATSTIIAIVLAEISLGAFNELAAKELSLDTQLQNPAFLGILVGFVLIVGVLSGSYPAFYLSSFKPIASLKGKIASGFQGKTIRNGLVVFQFTISIALVISAFFVQKQLSYTSNIDLGYDKDNLFQLHNLEQFSGDIQTVKNTLMGNPAFSAIGHSSALPPNVFAGDRYKATGTEDVVQLSNVKIDEDYFQTLNPKLLLGRSFDKDIETDKYGIVLNVSAVKALGWGTPDTYTEDSPLGKSMSIASGDEYALKVIGIVEDFNFNSLRNAIGPLVILHLDNDKVWDYGGGVSFLSMRLNPEVIHSGESLKDMIAAIKTQMLSLDPTFPFEYSFMDQGFDNSFRSEQRMGKVLNVFTVMAIAIACLGLFGLAAFSAEQRKKELGVRKVLGAKASNLMMLFSTEFTRLVIISLMVAAPLSYFIVDSWLADFAYKTPIDISVFIIAGIAALIIAWSTISFQSLKAAYRNPVDSLRDE
ncbi:MAG: FtsX-like permease family protein, partial [Roseivirga sp.]|nr:FtsX-like permease family protein [Roseivirga sp.]